MITDSKPTLLSPLKIGTTHFVGIGGIGMSGIAEILHALGYQVTGSDRADNANVKRLRSLGIKVSIGHAAENLNGVSVVVVSSAISPSNPEVVAARAARIPVIRRAEMLAELMRMKCSVAVSGTHGKTTTTSLVAALFEAADMDPTVVNGGIINSWGTNARLGTGDWIIVESDESDGSFTRLPATVAIVTNIDPEHMDHYADFDAVRAAYASFIENIPFYGFAVLCVDHPEVQALIPRLINRRLVTYGFSEQADIRASNMRATPDGSTFDVTISDRRNNEVRTIGDITIPLVGQHNVLNALAAVSVACQVGIGDESIVRGLRKIEGVKRRFTRTGVVNGITIIDDYGHHPVEIIATLKAASQARGAGARTIAVVQPHRYSRLAGLFREFCTCFNEASTVIVADVYPAGESPIEGATRDALVEGLLEHGHRDVIALEDSEQLAAIIASRANPGDYVVCLGAGSITQWANALPEQLGAIVAQSAPSKLLANASF